MSTHAGQCFCGAVQFKLSGEPAAMGYCHCESCRSWSASPLNAFSLWPPAALQITKGAEHIAGFSKTPNSLRQWCTQCGGHLFSEHPTMGLVDVYAAMLPTLRFEPALHVHYGEKVLPVKDGLPKLQDMPKEMGGSGTLLAE